MSMEEIPRNFILENIIENMQEVGIICCFLIYSVVHNHILVVFR